MTMSFSGLKFAAVGAAFAIGFAASVEDDGLDSTDVGLWPTLSLSVTTAEARPARRAVRRTARRTSRRTTARMNYYSALPAGCVLQGPYYYCGGVYYQAAVQNGQTVYVIVTP